MKKRILALFTVLLLAVLMTAVVAATPAMSVVPATGVDTSALEEGDTFDVYIVISPFSKIGTSTNYIYRVTEDTATGAPTASNSKITALKYTLTWDEGSLEVSDVGTFGTHPTSNTDARDAGNGYTYAYLAQTNAINNAKIVALPTTTGVGSGASNSGTLVIDYTDGIAAVDVSGTANDGKVGGFLVRGQSSAPTTNVVVAKVTFRVVAGATGGEDLPITLSNAYTYNSTNYTKDAADVTVTVLAGCAHADKTALNPEQLAAAGKENVAATCLTEGVTWYQCNDDCGEIISVTSNKLDHNYTVEKYLTGKEPTCLSKGQKAMFCSVTEGCTEYDSATVTDAPALGHEFIDDNHAYSPATCTEDGYDLYWCTRCNYVSPDKSDVIAVTYKEGNFATPAGAAAEIPDKVKLAALGHDWVLDRTENGITYYACSRDCGVAEQEVAVSDTVRYVSTNGGGDGSSVDSTVTLGQAFDAFKDLPADVDCTIYLVGKVVLPNRQVSSNNTVAKSFEETKHEATVTITTAPGTAKAELHFPFNTTSMYFLYGPTVFDNIKVSSETTGSSSGSSASISIVARGFDVTMTENFEAISKGSGITYTKTSGSFAYAVDPMELNIPDCKLYLVGGHYTNGGYEGYSATNFDVNMHIYGGTYWVVAGSSRTASQNENCEINMHFGGNAKIGQLIPISTTTGSTAEGTVVNMHYYSGFEAVLVYRAQNASTTGEYTVNHFFHKGSGDLRVGDFMMGNQNNHGRNVNVYYYDFDASAKAMAKAVYDKGVSNAYSYDIYNGVGSHETMTFTEWCVEYGGGHDYVDGECTFCGVTPCKSHVTEFVVKSLPTCQEPGVSYTRCTVCFEHIGEDILVTDSNAHNFQWDLTVSPIVSRCIVDGCDEVRGTYEGETPNAIYVSENGYGDGGFTADYPLSNFETAMKLAASLGEDAYVYIVDSITLEPNYVGTTTHTVFVEPAHDNHITIGGYKTSGVMKFSAENGGRILYNLNGDTTFENIEFAEWSSTNPGYSFSYLIANHNHLTLGENVSSSYERHLSGSNYHNGKLVVIGGCYHTNYTLPAANGTNCTNTDSHVTFYSGNFYDVIGGSAGIACGFENGTITFDFFGDIVVQDYFAAGSYQKPAGDIVMNFNGGNVATAAMFSLSGYNASGEGFHNANVKDVTVKIYSGSVVSNSFQASQSSTTLRPIGATYAGETLDDGSTYFDITAHLDSLTICYDPSNGSAKATAFIFGDMPHSKTITYQIIGETYCEVNANGEHTKGEIVEEVASICAKQGYGIYVCSACGDEYTVALDPVAHSFGAAEMATAANCINPQIDKEVCTECGFIKYSVGDVAATGVHEYDENNVCVYCSQSLQDLCEHVWDGGVEVSTGCGLGYEYTCTNGCGKTKIEITSSDHNFGKYTVTVQPTDTEPGVKTRTCKSCGKVETALLYADGSVANNEAIAVDSTGNLADVEIATSKLTKAERTAINALIQDAAYGSEVKVSYNVDGSVANVTYSIPLPAEYADMQNLQVIVKDDEGNIHVVQFTIEKGYIVFTF